MMLNLLLNKKKNGFLLFPFFVAALAGCITFSQGINLTDPDFLNHVGVKKNFNPHKGGNCNVCHKAAVETLESSGQSEREVLSRRSMQTDLVRLCDDCHEASKWPHHLTGIKPKNNKSNLPLDSNGFITCATTCHNIHTTDPELSKGKLLDSFDNLCLSCHNG